MSFNITLTEEQTKTLQQFIFEATTEAVQRAVSVAGSDKDFLNQSAMSDWLGVSTSTLINYTRDGLPVSTQNGRKFYSKKQVTKWLLAKQIGGVR
ncbi:MAG: DNA-binding protein [Lactococcus sp.]|nr:DNA-binding protein [Lactococcus sp.]MDN5403429.1 DNA-binding protein [Lactococcus sp.]MDN5410498.1 DNA-binding protein [Lactococcus sp.]MDN5412179.1 DNA-binding protein [Lactococcus sp.]MDN5436890.1 DNA-binding protein [Lactococcus sp.]MDN5461980.1 DNA-binding protein [Lactococcus sp.]